ncbi:MAG: chaperone NapD [Thiotrichales bacterium]
MNLSGILVITVPAHFDGVVAALNALPGVEVHHTDPATGRIVVVQEAESVGAEVDGIKRIKALPHVVMAEMAYHYFADDQQTINGIPQELQSDDNVQVPAYLRD